MDISPDKNKSKKRPPEKSLRFPLAIHVKLVKLCERLKLNQVEAFVQMVEYFHRTKKSPSDIGDELLKNTLVKNHDTYIRFVRAQENNLLIPIKENVDRMIGNQHNIVKYFNEQVLNANTMILKESKANSEILQDIFKRLESKEKLKGKFLLILEGYIQKREEMGAFKQREKEELILSTRKLINEL